MQHEEDNNDDDKFRLIPRERRMKKNMNGSNKTAIHFGSYQVKQTKFVADKKDLQIVLPKKKVV